MSKQIGVSLYGGNQVTLGNGCVCDSGCDQCARLAESWEAMREALAWCQARLFVHEGSENPQYKAASAALALADKVSR